MKRATLLLILSLSGLFSLFAREGMYLPYLLQKINAPEMQAMGMRISAEELYSVNHSTLKDAIVHFGGGCTAELVSDQGLLLTNHHCGYRSIQKHSSVEHDYLTDGFWARSMAEELPNKGLTASILQSMRDVSEEVLDGISTDMNEKERNERINEHIATLLSSYRDNPFVKAEVKAFYYGNQYIMMISKVFRDVRLVGAPPSNIGKFGGDTDNWMWPRHTGDFSVFRIYTNTENEPANYAKDNIPYHPKRSLQISLKGYQAGDFTLVYGYPGRTSEYLPAEGVALITRTVNPFKIALRGKELQIMKHFMQQDKKTRIQYSAKYAGLANGWKKWQGENRGIKRLQTIARKQQEELEFTQWAKREAPEYAELIPTFNREYRSYTPYEMGYQYFVELGYYQGIIRYIWSYFALDKLSSDKESKADDIKKELQKLRGGLHSFYKDYNRLVEQKLLQLNIKSYLNFPYTQVSIPAILDEVKKQHGGHTDRWVEGAMKKSVFANPEKLKAFLKNYKKSHYKKLHKDPLYRLAQSYYQNYRRHISPGIRMHQQKIDSLQRIYMKALLSKHAGEYLYPDANSTLRVAYGQVAGYEPRDGVEYNYYTTLKGIMDKENPEIYDYVVEDKLKELYRQRRYGRYADSDGSMHVCFTASNHTTGGNSGSPVLNADGKLIGINFDRNWEGTMSDLNYDPEQCRNIILDIRYCLFIIDKYAGAHRLIQEMNIE